MPDGPQHERNGLQPGFQKNFTVETVKTLEVVAMNHLEEGDKFWYSWHKQSQYNVNDFIQIYGPAIVRYRPVPQDKFDADAATHDNIRHAFGDNSQSVVLPRCELYVESGGVTIPARILFDNLDLIVFWREPICRSPDCSDQPGNPVTNA